VTPRGTVTSRQKHEDNSTPVSSVRFAEPAPSTSENKENADAKATGLHGAVGRYREIRGRDPKIIPAHTAAVSVPIYARDRVAVIFIRIRRTFNIWYKCI